MTTPVKIATTILTSNTTLYTAGAAIAMLTSLELTNTTSVDITVDVWWSNAGGSTNRYFAKTLTVPALSVASWRGLVTLDVATETIKAVASATGVDAVGTVMER